MTTEMSTPATVVSMVRDPFLNTDDACGYLGVPKRPCRRGGFAAPAVARAPSKPGVSSRPPFRARPLARCSRGVLH